MKQIFSKHLLAELDFNGKPDIKEAFEQVVKNHTDLNGLLQAAGLRDDLDLIISLAKRAKHEIEGLD